MHTVANIMFAHWSAKPMLILLIHFLNELCSSHNLAAKCGLHAFTASQKASHKLATFH